jgi:hypothetical protein
VQRPNDRLSNHKHWRFRAEEMRSAAEDMVDPTNRAIALRIAADYDRLAEHAERRSLSLHLDKSA